MANKQAKSIRDKISNFSTSYPVLFFVGGFLLGFISFIFLVRAFTGLYELLNDLVPEAVGILITVFFIDRFYAARNKKKETKELQIRLVLEAQGQSNEVAKAAIDRMRHEHWLTKKDRIRLLEGVDLSHAQLAGANLINASLVKTTFNKTNLVGAYLQGADLRGAQMLGAFMDYAFLSVADLESANLTDAILPKGRLWLANLFKANLTGTILDDADLNKAYLRDTTITASTSFNPNTSLPDSIPSGSGNNRIYSKYWLPSTTMSAYVDGTWEPDYLKRNWTWNATAFEGEDTPDWVRRIRKERFG